MKQILQNFKLWLKNDRVLSPETIDKYMGNLNILFTRLKINDINQLKSVVLNKRLLDDFWSNFAGGKKVPADSTRANYMSSLKAFAKFCYINEHLQEDISNKIVMPKMAWLFLEGFDKNEQAKIRDHIAGNLKTEKDLRDAALIMFLWATATRISEALKLKCHPESFIYFHDESIRSGSFHVSDGHVYVHIMGKGKKDRIIAVSNDALHYLNLYLDKRSRKNEILFHNIKNNRSNKINLSRNAAGVIIDNLLKKCNITKTKGLRTHLFRHTAINTWLEKGYTREEIITMTGHANISGLDPYARRNKRLTIPFAEEGKSTLDVSNKELKQLENISKLRYSPQF